MKIRELDEAGKSGNQKKKYVRKCRGRRRNGNVSSGRRVAERKYRTERREYVRKGCATEEGKGEEEKNKKEKAEKVHVEA